MIQCISYLCQSTIEIHLSEHNREIIQNILQLTKVQLKYICQDTIAKY